MQALQRVRVRRNEATHRLSYVPIVTLMAHSRCNCRCTMCDIWKNNRIVDELRAADLEPHLADLAQLRTRHIIFSGGEALLHSDLWSLCELLAPLRARLTLLTTGLLLARHADQCVQRFSDIIVSLDGPQATHDAVRNVPDCFGKLAGGVAALRRIDAGFPIHARSVVQRCNYGELSETVDAALELGLDSISFLPADISSEAFNHPGGWIATDVARVGLSQDDIEPFANAVENLVETRQALFDSGFIVESPDKLRRMVSYFRAHALQGEFPAISCNAPWVSVVIEANGDVRPCFFHKSFGNIRNERLLDILNGESAMAFRRSLDVTCDAVCRKCVCTLKYPGA